MRTTKYLFDIEPEELDNLNYWDALNYKLKHAWPLFIDLHITERDDVRKFYVNKAIEHTKELISEREECT